MSLYGLGLRASFKISDTIRDRGLQAPKTLSVLIICPMARTRAGRHWTFTAPKTPKVPHFP